MFISYHKNGETKPGIKLLSTPYTRCRSVPPLTRYQIQNKKAKKDHNCPHQCTLKTNVSGHAPQSLPHSVSLLQSPLYPTSPPRVMVVVRAPPTVRTQCHRDSV